eukprot:6459331-Amphidinium_carterae.2
MLHATQHINDFEKEATDLLQILLSDNTASISFSLGPSKSKSPGFSNRSYCRGLHDHDILQSDGLSLRWGKDTIKTSH